MLLNLKNTITIIAISFVTAAANAQRIKENYFKGEINASPIEMVIKDHSYVDNEGINHQYYTGYYYYSDKLVPMYFQDNTDEKNTQTISLTTLEDDEEAANFSGTYKSGTFSGKWTQSNQTFDFTLKAAKPKVAITNYQFEKLAYYQNNQKIFSNYLLNWDLPKDEKLKQKFLATITNNQYNSAEKLAQSEYEEEAKEFETIIKESLDYDKIEEIEDSYRYRFEKNNSLTPVINADAYFIMAHNTYMYSGGAHGLYHTTYYNYSHKDQKILKIEDILDIKYQDRIAALIKRTIKKKHNIAESIPLDESNIGLFISDEVGMSKNFTINKEGITFYYGLYEITPYVVGMYDILVPFEHLLPYMNPTFKR